jgi:hypothetical protein
MIKIVIKLIDFKIELQGYFNETYLMYMQYFLNLKK